LQSFLKFRHLPSTEFDSFFIDSFQQAYSGAQPFPEEIGSAVKYGIRRFEQIPIP
jgi:hypothetical protein